MNGDGAIDLAVANWYSDDVSILLNDCLPACSTDLDGSGDIGFSDLTQLLSAWGSCADCLEDLDGDAEVGFSDLTTLLAAWGRARVTDTSACERHPTIQKQRFLPSED